MMLNLRQVSFIALLSFVSISCGLIEPNGIYIADGFENTRDTLILFENGKYEHKIWDKITDYRITNNIGHWGNKSGSIVCYNFLFNEDDIFYTNDSVDYSRAFEIHTFSSHIFSRGFVINFGLEMHYNKFYPDI